MGSHRFWSVLSSYLWGIHTNETLLIIYILLSLGHVVHLPRPKSEPEASKVFPPCLYVSASSLLSEAWHTVRLSWLTRLILDDVRSLRKGVGTMRLTLVSTRRDFSL